MNNSIGLMVPIPAGYNIACKNVALSECQHYVGNILRVLKTISTSEVILRHEPGNLHDVNAYQVLMTATGWLGRKEYLIGYIPKSINEEFTKILGAGIALLRLRKIWLSGTGKVQVYGDLLASNHDAREVKVRRSVN